MRVGAVVGERTVGDREEVTVGEAVGGVLGTTGAKVDMMGAAVGDGDSRMGVETASCDTLDLVIKVLTSAIKKINTPRITVTKRNVSRGFFSVVGRISGGAIGKSCSVSDKVVKDDGEEGIDVFVMIFEITLTFHQLFLL
jgi:hypothetical protein